jgi:hypothetical protein
VTKNNIDTLEVGKKGNSTKITAIVVLGVVFALALFILISSLATVGLNPRFVARPDEVYIYKAGATSASGQITDDEELYGEFMEYYDTMFTSSFLSALFNGRLSGYTLSEKQISTSSNMSSLFGTNPYVKFKYDDKITLTYQNGAEYRSLNKTKETVVFDELYFQVTEQNELHEFKLYVVDYNATQNSSKYTYYVEVNLVANTSDLYENITHFYNSLMH